MANNAVSSLLEKLPGILGELPCLLGDEIKLLSGLEEKINSLINEVQFINSFLKSSEGKRNNDTVKLVVSQIRDAAYQAEDVIDTYVANVTKQRRRNVAGKLVNFPTLVKELHDADNKIKKIRSCIDDIYKNKERYRIVEGEFKSEEEGEEQQVSESLRAKRRVVEEEHVGGLDNCSIVVINQLKERDSRLKVVSIIGQGGLGKTTLARKIYDNTDVKKLFPCRAWGYVSNAYRPMELLLSLLKCFQSSTSEYNNLNEEELKMKVRECLKGKKYLIVLDDIWEPQVWDKIKDVFPDEQNSSRILITSRIKDVASHCGTPLPFGLPFLNEEDSWTLFIKKVFRGEECPSYLEPLGKEIAESCRGLPLGIIVLAGLARKKMRSSREETVTQWSRLKKITWHITRDKTEVMDILKLSYNNLPRRLKKCFLYFALYPEDYEIRVRQLMQIWTAEGFINPRETGIPNPPQVEEIVEYYLDELVDCSLVQVTRRRWFDGGVKRCRIHDLLRELCILESKSTELLEVCTEMNMDTLRNPRRLSLHEGRAQSSKFNQSSTHSLFFFSKERYQCDLVMKKLKFARVLYAEASVFSALCTGLEMMILLKYLKVSTYAMDIPASICSLLNLETLHFKQINSTSRMSHPLPMGMKRCRDLSGLTKLRSIKLIRFQRLPLKFPSNVVKITLQAGDGHKIDNIKDIMETLGRLTNLQILKLKHFGGLSDHIFATGQFPRLRVFQMTFMLDQKWILQKGAMPNLQYILICRCGLDELPEELWSLTSLKHVCVVDALKPLNESLENMEVNNGSKHSIALNCYHAELKNGCKLSVIDGYHLHLLERGQLLIS